MKRLDRLGLRLGGLDLGRRERAGGKGWFEDRCGGASACAEVGAVELGPDHAILAPEDRAAGRVDVADRGAARIVVAEGRVARRTAVSSGRVTTRDATFAVTRTVGHRNRHAVLIPGHRGAVGVDRADRLTAVLVVTERCSVRDAAASAAQRAALRCRAGIEIGVQSLLTTSINQP